MNIFIEELNSIYKDKWCSVCSGKNNVMLLRFIQDHKSGTVIFICEECRKHLKNILQE